MKFTIYRIVSKNQELKNCYIGKTRNLTSRIRQHKSDSINIQSRRYNLPMYQYIREHGGFENFEVINLKDIWIDGAENTSIHEQYYFELYGGFINCLNTYYPNRKARETSLIYYYKHKEQVTEYQAKYRNEHKEQTVKYYIEHKEKIKEQTKLNFAKRNKINL